MPKHFHKIATYDILATEDAGVEQTPSMRLKHLGTMMVVLQYDRRWQFVSKYVCSLDSGELCLTCAVQWRLGQSQKVKS